MHCLSNRSIVRACAALFAVATVFPQSTVPTFAPAAFPSAETLNYSVEWRLIYAGSARLSLTPERPSQSDLDWTTQVHLESAGLVSKLFKLNDNYSAELQHAFCTESTDLDAVEGKKHYSTKVNYDHGRGKAIYVERDLIKNAVVKSSEVEIPACASDIIGSLYKLRTLHLEPGQSTQLPMSDGKRTANARVEAQDREQIQTKAGTFHTVRYECYVFNGVLYQKKARLLIWLTDDARKVPVQIQTRMNFPVGTITLQLDKEDRPANSASATAALARPQEHE